MKSFPIKKRKTRTKSVLPEVRPHLPKPDFPRHVFWKVHEVERIYMDWGGDQGQASHVSES